MAAMTAISPLAGCGDQGKSASAPATIQATAGGNFRFLAAGAAGTNLYAN